MTPLFSILAAFVPLVALASATAATSPPEGLPIPGERRPMTFAEPAEKTLPNGLRVIVIDRPGLPLVSAGCILRRGAESDLPKLAGLAHFTGELLMRGTTKRSATQLALDLEELGASIEIEATWDQTSALLTSLGDQADAALAILAEVIRQPAFSAEEIGRYRKEAIDELTVALQQPGQLARVVAATAILAPLPYSHSANGTPASLARIQRSDLTGFHRDHFQPGQAALILVGDLRAPSGFTLAEKWFGDWAGPTSEAARAPAEKDPPIPETPSAILIDQPTAGQAAVYVGRRTIARKSDDYFISQVANGVLGGGYSARLNREVRIKRGLSYGCGSKLFAYRGTGLFGASAQTKNESAGEVVAVIHGELQRLARDPIPAEEFAARKLVLTGSFERELETNEGYVKRIAEFFVHDQPAAGFQPTIERINAVTPNEANAFAAKALTPETTTVIVVGQAKLCEEPLRKIFPNLRVIPRNRLDLDAPTLEAPPKEETKRTKKTR